MRRKTTPAARLLFAVLGAIGLATASTAAPLPESGVPEPLKAWIPWAMHGHEVLACPVPFNGSGDRVCVWPSRLELKATKAGAEFRFEVQVFGGTSPVTLPGEPGRWPQDLKVDGRPLVAAGRDDRPVAQLPAGNHVITGALHWTEMPQDLLLPANTGTLLSLIHI